MDTFIVQYSVPTEKASISDWREYMTKVKAKSDKDAIRKFNKGRNGTWLILDCWKD
jgi:hypothetical protein